MLRKEIIVANPRKEIARAIGPLLRRLAAEGVPSCAEKIYGGSRNSIYRLEVEGLGEVSIKEFRVPRFPNNYVYCGLRGSKARRSYEHALRLLEEGIQTPEPYGYIEVRSGLIPSLGRSYYICAHTPYLPIRDWEEHPESVEATARCIGRGLARLHRAGILHRDFSRGNVLIVTDSDGNPADISLLDLNRMEFGVTDRQRLMPMFGGLCWTLPALRLLTEAYCRELGLDTDEIYPSALREQQRFVKAFKRKYNIKD